MVRIALLHHPYLHVPLIIEGFESYASLNFEHIRSVKGIVPNNRIHVYLLDPLKGSITFYLEYSHDDDYYYIEMTDTEIDSLIIYSLNEAIRNHLRSIQLLPNANGRLKR